MADRPARSAAMQLGRRVLAVLAFVMLALGAGEASGAFERSAMPVPSHVLASFRLETSPHVGSVAVIGSWDGFKGRRQLARRESPTHSVLMKEMKEWQADVSVPCGDVSHRYRFIVDGKDDDSHGGGARWRRARPSAKDLETPYTHVCSCVSLDEGAVEDGAALGASCAKPPCCNLFNHQLRIPPQVFVRVKLDRLCAFDSSHRR